MKTLRLLSVLFLVSLILASCKTEENEIPVSEVRLSETTLELAVGDDFYLTATVLPENAANKSVTWSCSPENVLTVYQSGQVVAMEEGEGTVTVTTTDGGHKAECRVYVRNIR